MNYGIIVAAGRSERMGSDVDKAFLALGTKPVLLHAVLAFEQCPVIDGIILVVRKDRIEAATQLTQMFGCNKVRAVLAGGAARQASVRIGLDALSDEVKIVAVHDGARPCVTSDVIAETVKSAKRYGSGVAAVKITDTIKEVDQGHVVRRTIDRTKLWAVQTPQTFRRDLLQKAFEVVEKKKAVVTDEASAVELAGEEVHLVPAAWSNIKVTTPQDLVLAATLLKL